ncbi:MAG TPA: penicillin-binding transpeptidase domain-containing protein [Solirubrobacteraceae bacterium]|nr:penicillin-binding transpeptidase domain-containing protein [Solirubrobacteraceae bacterium]
MAVRGEGRGSTQRPGSLGRDVVYPLEVALARLSPRARRALAMAGAAALLAGVVVGATQVSSEREVVQRYLSAWEEGDHLAMHRLLTPEARRAVSRDEFRAHMRAALVTATATDLTVDDLEVEGDRARARVTVETRAFGTVREPISLGLQEADDGPRVAWREHHVFPGVRPGQKLQRDTRLPERAALQARDGTLLARGPTRTSELGAVTGAVVGRLGAIPPERADRLAALGWPPDAQVGVSGLERAFDERLMGRPGGVLRAGERPLARSTPRPAEPVRTSVSVPVQRASVDALAGRLGGVLALDPRSGEVLGTAGIALDGLQPPGSTFKVVTLAGALESGITEVGESFPVQTAATLEGVELQNADSEPCGGSLTVSFARSCNSVFAPLGAELGARRLVAEAEDFGFNAPTAIPGAAISTLPPAGEIGDDLAVGATAIGQGRVQATTLQMALVAATIAREGVLPRPTFRPGAPAEGVRAVRREVAAVIGRLMVAVVSDGTGQAAALPGVEVAGKTGTAELRSTQGCAAACPGGGPADTDAWFLAYAPERDPRVAVAVLLVGSGSGGETAAPAARGVLGTGLQTTAGD